MNIPEEVQNYSAISSGIFYFAQKHYQPTYDWFVYIEEIKPGYVRYINLDGRRWEVWGTCDKRGDCLIGAVDNYTDKISNRLDVPVTPEFDSCCGSDIFKYVELPKLVIDSGN